MGRQVTYIDLYATICLLISIRAYNTFLLVAEAMHNHKWIIVKFVNLADDSLTISCFLYCVFHFQAAILKASFLPELRRVLQTKNNWQSQMHAAGTIRNLAAGEHIQVNIKIQDSFILSKHTCTVMK